MFEQDTRIELAYPVWKTGILTVVLILQIVGTHRFELQSSESESDILTIVLYPNLLEQHNGIEPSYRPWQGRVITVIRMLHGWRFLAGIFLNLLQISVLTEAEGLWLCNEISMCRIIDRTSQRVAVKWQIKEVWVVVQRQFMCSGHLQLQIPSSRNRDTFCDKVRLLISNIPRRFKVEPALWCNGGSPGMYFKDL